MTNKPTKKEQLRLRVFAGPNGSGKSTVIQQVREYKSNGKNLDFGYYVNADEIAVALKEQGFSFQSFSINVTNKEFKETVLESGLINTDFTESHFYKSYLIRKNIIKCKDLKFVERLAQIIADFLRKKLLSERKKFSFETVFSHPSKLDIMKQAGKLAIRSICILFLQNPQK